MVKTIRQQIKIDGMHCGSCAMSIEMDLEELSGVEKVEVSYPKQLLTVEIDPQKITLVEIIDIVRKSGYQATAIEE